MARGPVSPSADRRVLRSRALGIAGTALTLLGLVLTVTVGRTDAPSGERVRPVASVAAPVGHVFVINIENKRFDKAWGAGSAAPYLAKKLRSKGVLLRRYFGVGHHSLPNYVAQISGQGPDRATQGDCPTYTPFRTTRAPAAPQQAVGNGCVYPSSVRTLPRQLTAAGLSWRGYMEDMGTPCQHPRLGARDPWTQATAQEQYATRHDPFVYFRSITAHASYCRAHVVPLAQLTRDLATVSTTRTLTYITPDLCHDGHDATCANGGLGGMRAVNAWMKTWVPRILASPAYRADGMLVITSDESDDSSAACCGETPGPNVRRDGISGPGGGRIGALVLSPYVAPGTVSARPYDHYSLLATIEDVFGLPRLGYARTVPRVFGPDVFNAS
jgi:phosphatidylinositol-3-phosphatase